MNYDSGQAAAASKSANPGHVIRVSHYLVVVGRPYRQGPPGCEDRCMLLHGFTSALGQCLTGVSRVYRRHFEGIALRELQARDAGGWAWVWEA